MFIAMNRFKVAKGAEADFEAIWRRRESHLHETEGFVAFHLLRGPVRDDHCLYASHTLWQSEAHFSAWTKSEQFRKAHANAGDAGTRATYLAPPEFEGFTVIQEVDGNGVIRDLA